MSFKTEQKPLPAEVRLMDLQFENAKGDGKPAVAEFSDGTRIEFPKGCKFGPDHEFDEFDRERIIRRRLRFLPPIDAEGKPTQPSFLIPQYVSPEYVQKCIERIIKKV